MKLKLLRTTNYELRTGSRGFTLVEMIVVVGIFAMLSGVIFTNYGNFNTKASLDNLSHQIALIVREAQVYGISVSQSQPNQFKGYGAYFSVATLAKQKEFLLFNDYNPTNKRYDAGASPCLGVSGDECIERVSVNTGDIVEKITANGKTTAPGFELKEVNIVFTRPNPDANIFGIDLNDASFDNLADVEIYIKSPKGEEKQVVVWSTGQIAVE